MQLGLLHDNCLDGWPGCWQRGDEDDALDDHQVVPDLGAFRRLRGGGPYPHPHGLWGQGLLRYAFFHEDPMWGEVGIVPLEIVLRIFVAAWVVRNVVKLDGRDLLPALLTAFGVSFFLLFGWYSLLLGFDGGFFYWVAGLLVGCALLLAKIDARPGEAAT